MSATPQSAQDDLAFLRALVSAGDGIQRPFGQGYFAAGLCYGAQMIASGAQVIGWLPTGPAWGLTIGAGPTVVFLAILAWVLVRARRAPPTGLVGRAISQVFGAIGLANVALVAVIGQVAWREHNFTTWLIYPCCVFVLQGAAWMVAFSLRRQAWLLAVCLGWVATALVMAFLVQQIGLYILVAGVGLLAFMLVPGAVLMRRPAAGA